MAVVGADSSEYGNHTNEESSVTSVESDIARALISAIARNSSGDGCHDDEISKLTTELVEENTRKVPWSGTKIVFGSDVGVHRASYGKGTWDEA